MERNLTGNRGTYRAVISVVAILVLVILLAGCASSQTGVLHTGIQDTSTLWNIDSYPLNVCMGVSAPYSTREKEVAEALSNIVNKVAFIKILGSYPKGGI